jgi:hypothetical protein
MFSMGDKRAKQPRIPSRIQTVMKINLHLMSVISFHLTKKAIADSWSARRTVTGDDIQRR